MLGPGTPLRPGATWLLSVDGEGRPGSAGLWRLEEGAPQEPGHVGFHGRARRSLVVASALARADVPLLVDARSLRDPAWRAVSVLAPTKPVYRLAGGSFGLAMVLAASARLLGLPLPTGLVATAAVSESGRVEEVDGLEAKLALLGHAALDMELTCVVAASQVDRARAHAPGGVRVVGVERLDEAIALAFDEASLAEHLGERWSAPEARRAAAATFFRIAMDGSNRLLGWRSLARAAELLASLSEDDPSAWRVDVAARIARRHANEPTPIRVAPAVSAALPRPRRIQLLAHQVQAAADAHSDDWREQLAAGWAALPEAGEEHGEELELLGALGRAEAAWGRYVDAGRALRRAVRGWLALDAEPRASYALCELLRVVGIGGDGLDPEVTEAVARFDCDPRPDATSRAFVRCALGRAQAQLGQTADAVETLTDPVVRWEHCPAHVRATRSRWLAYAVYPREPHRARRAWSELTDLAQRKPRVTGFADALARLDRLALGAETGSLEEAVARVVGAPELGQEARRILEFVEPITMEERAAALRAHWRY